jgi:general transcription factor 3C polypeptide 3 (transcription factor C subunit 4)
MTLKLTYLVDLAAEFEETATEFHGVSFQDWFDMLCQYAVICARQGAAEECFGVLDRIAESNVFCYQQSLLRRHYFCRLACGIKLDNSKQVSESVRWLMKRHPFRSDLIRLYSYANGLCSIHEAYSTQLTQKTLLRFIKASDYALLSPLERKRLNFSMKERSVWEAKFIYEKYRKLITEHDPNLLSLFGHVMCCGASYPSALNYYFRAFAVEAEDPILNLCIAASYIQHGLKRLAENRHYQIQQGMAFAERYRKLRCKDNVPEFCQEAEYNLGRLYHLLGLTYLAIPAYERTIAMSKNVNKRAQDRGEPAEDFGREAAFAMQSALAVAGDLRGAMKVTKEMLVIE